ncbi:MAG: hypothetical protein INQ03_10695 [Candidatus Heimdallarchaeota archaeon]|nr:hypothetical protein [Candidatus Heimdallarchaeota archaeon]
MSSHTVSKIIRNFRIEKILLSCIESLNIQYTKNQSQIKLSNGVVLTHSGEFYKAEYNSYNKTAGKFLVSLENKYEIDAKNYLEELRQKSLALEREKMNKSIEEQKEKEKEIMELKKQEKIAHKMLKREEKAREEEIEKKIDALQKKAQKKGFTVVRKQVDNKVKLVLRRI